MMSQRYSKSYLELIQLPTYTERLNYLMTHSGIGSETFGFDRYLNQMLYRSSEWKKTRRQVILRDKGCDLGVDGYELNGGVTIHHINPITVEDIKNNDPKVFDMNNLITTSNETHRLIHYGSNEALSHGVLTERSKNDTCPWRK